MRIAVNTRILLAGKLEGVGKFTHEVLQRLVVQHPEHEFYFFFDRPYDKQFIYAPNVKPVVIYPPARHPFLFYLWFEIMLPRILRQLKPDVFFSPDNFTTLRTTVPRVTVIHDLAYQHFPEEKRYFDRRYYQKFIPRFAAASRLILTVSEFSRKDILKSFNLPPDKVKVAPCGVSDFFKPTPFAQQIDIRQKYCAGEMYFVFVGALQPRKNLVNLFKAFDAFKNLTRSEVNLVIVGRKAWKAGSIVKAYQAMTHKTEVVFTGRVSDAEVRQLYGGALALVFASVFEGFGLPIIEAQKCDCPVITSNTSSMPEVAADSALLVDPHSPDAICQALVQLYHYPERRDYYIRRGRENCRRYTWQQTTNLVYQGLQEAGVKSKKSFD
ncbi:glycosyltransferase family 4 protein [Adhaeribacter radiodurans]|uniref:Glycosyltransferase family 4 protein n=1 Tax=Adhaeribacter radiodurans TaxID=2745197 RepID=A0A7L7LF24_9BACT|nr:glycosyltransferase family 1 protein [Adhaeribacter radiodurans]QMU31357.1 glycosyltransferase family 4 protein [Adhaeribacter radiodurans]